jgi:hypothetical protein
VSGHDLEGWFDSFELPMTFDAYLPYMLKETYVDSANAGGACSAELGAR